jgi:hypothetical protein
MVRIKASEMVNDLGDDQRHGIGLTAWGRVDGMGEGKRHGRG